MSVAAMLEKTPQKDLEAGKAEQPVPDAALEPQTQAAKAPSRLPGILLKFLKLILQIVLLVLVLGLATFFMLRLINSAPEPRSRPPFQTVFTVEAAPVELRDNQPVFSVFGTVAAARDVELRALSPGEITAVSANLQAGQRVEVGDLLVEIDTFEYEGALAEARANLAEAAARRAEKEARIAGAQAQIEGTERQLQLARDDLTRAEDLVARGTLPARDLENRRIQVNERELTLVQRNSNLQVERAGVAQLEAQVDRLEWRVQQAERALENTRLTAPFAGVIRSANAAVGRSANGADVLVSLYDDSELEARFTLSDAQYGRLFASEQGLVGRSVRALWNVGGRDYAFSGEISRTGAQISSERGGVEMFARLEAGSDAITLRPGSFVAVEVPDRIFERSARIPETALYDGDHVYAILDGQLERRDVEVLAYDGSDAIVRGDLVDGEMLLNTRLAQISEGIKVRTADDPPANAGRPARGSSRPGAEGERSRDGEAQTRQSGERSRRENGERPSRQAAD
ncbi:MAG: HlyD family efflux transporter periplasmic adaptor subunit [Pseudomonadota bacterium]